MQTASLLFTLLAPQLLWVLCRVSPGARWPVRHVMAICLLALEVMTLADKVVSRTPLDEALPMHLCDWALVTTAAALWWGWRLGFELGYFWGLAGTFQALITPAIDPTLPWWRLALFFFAHALIVVAVLHLMLTEKQRPVTRSLARVFLCSEVYLVAALLANALTGGNYGFLSHPPEQASLLDVFSKNPFFYVLEINLAALVLFPLLYLPWAVWDWTRRNRSAVAPTPPA